MKYMGSTGGASGALAGAFVQRKSNEDEFNNPPRTQKFRHSPKFRRRDLRQGADYFAHQSFERKPGCFAHLQR